MNCLDLRRAVLAQPLRISEEARAHIQACGECRIFAERQRELDAQLYEAMRVPAPDGLADRILVAQGIRRRRGPWAWAAAASLALAASAALLAPPFIHGTALAREAIAHVAEEPQSFRRAANLPAVVLASELGLQGLRLAGVLGEVTYAQLCPMRDGMARHLVVATAEGPITLLLMPGDERHRRRTLVESGGMTAISLPAARGSVAIVAASRAQALAVERALALS